MFDFAGSEIALIGIVALVLIGPKDLPIAIKSIATVIKKARRMAGEFQTHVDEMVREANLTEVRDQVNEIRRMDLKGQILKAVDSDGSIRKHISEPLTDFSPPPPPVPVHDVAPVPESPAAPAPGPAPVLAAPAFIPPSFAPAPAAASAFAEPPAPVPPAFVPPSPAHTEHA